MSSLIPKRIYAISSALLLLLACGEVKPPTCEDTEDHACFRGAFRDLIGSPVSDIKICAPDYPDIPCTRSDENGGWKIPGLPKDTDVIITAKHPEYVSSLFPQNTAWDWYDWYKVAMPLWAMDENAERLKVSLDADKGQLLFLVWEGLNTNGEDTEKISGVKAEIDPDSTLLFYGDGWNLASSDLNETSSSGSGGALNLPPGTYNLRLNGPAGPCAEHSFSFAHEADGNIPIPVRAGFTTAVDVICPIN